MFVLVIISIPISGVSTTGLSYGYTPCRARKSNCGLNDEFVCEDKLNEMNSEMDR